MDKIRLQGTNHYIAYNKPVVVSPQSLEVSAEKSSSLDWDVIRLNVATELLKIFVQKFNLSEEDIAELAVKQTDAFINKLKG